MCYQQLYGPLSPVCLGAWDCCFIKTKVKAYHIYSVYHLQP